MQQRSITFSIAVGGEQPFQADACLLCLMCSGALSMYAADGSPVMGMPIYERSKILAPLRPDGTRERIGNIVFRNESGVPVSATVVTSDADITDGRTSVIDPAAPPLYQYGCYNALIANSLFALRQDTATKRICVRRVRILAPGTVAAAIASFPVMLEAVTGISNGTTAANAIWKRDSSSPVLSGVTPLYDCTSGSFLGLGRETVAAIAFPTAAAAIQPIEYDLTQGGKVPGFIAPAGVNSGIRLGAPTGQALNGPNWSIDFVVL